MAIKRKTDFAFKKKRVLGFILVEMMVVVSLFALVFAIGAGMFFSLIKNANKIKNLNQVKQNGEYATSVMERMIRNARRITSSTATSVSILNPDGGTTTFACVEIIDESPTIASASAFGGADLGNLSLVDSGVKTETCSINVTDGQAGVSPDVVEINFTLVPSSTTLRTEERVSIDFQTTISLRNY